MSGKNRVKIGPISNKPCLQTGGGGGARRRPLPCLHLVLGKHLDAAAATSDKAKVICTTSLHCMRPSVQGPFAHHILSFKHARPCSSCQPKAARCVRITWLKQSSKPGSYADQSDRIITAAPQVQTHLPYLPIPGRLRLVFAPRYIVSALLLQPRDGALPWNLISSSRRSRRWTCDGRHVC